MSLPWFAFDADAYTGDTAHLTCEEHGAYLQLMLAYYRSEKPLPARDRALASIVKLPLERWLEAKPTLAAFFIEEGDVWRHERIESEIAERTKRHEETVRRGREGAELRWGKGKSRSTTKKAVSKQGSRTDNSHPNSPAIAPAIAKSETKLDQNVSGVAEPKPDHSQTNSPAIAPAILDSHPNGSAIAGPLAELKQTDAQEQEHINSLSARARARDSHEEEEDQDEDDEDDLGTPIDPKFWPDPNHIAMCKFDGADDKTIEAEVAAFIASKKESGVFSHDWDGSWVLWWKRWKEYRHKAEVKAAKRAGRTPPPPPPEMPPPLSMDEQMDRALERWVKGIMWPHRAFGPEPGMLGCKVPKHLLKKYGIDPVTGIVRKEDAEV